MQPGGRKATAGRQAEANLQSLREAAAGCRECPLGEPATQTVWGEGTPRAKLMLVGEQPGDREDLEGRPFVGPAGRMLDRALQELGWRREGLYVTNAVKHFKFEMRGKRRMHKTPGQREAMACLHWLESEIAAVRPAAIVDGATRLGAEGTRSVAGARGRDPGPAHPASIGVAARRSRATRVRVRGMAPGSSQGGPAHLRDGASLQFALGGVALRNIVRRVLVNMGRTRALQGVALTRSQAGEPSVSREASS